MRFLIVAISFVIFSHVATAGETGARDGCLKPYLTSKDFLALDAAKQTDELERLKDGLSQGCSVALTGLNYLSTSIPDDEVDMLQWYRLLVEVSEIQARQVVVQKSLIDQFLIKIQTLTERLEKKTNAVLKLISKVTKITAERDRAEARMADFSVQLTTLNEELRINSIRIAALAAREARIRNEYDAAQQTLIDRNVEIERLKAIVTSLRAEIIAEQGDAASLEKQVLEHDKTISELQDQITKLKDIITDRDAEIARLGGDISGLKNTIAAHAGVTSVMNDKIKSQKLEIDDLNADIIDRDAEIKILKAKNEDLAGDLAAETGRLISALKERDDALAAQAKAEAERDLHKQQFDNAHERLIALEKYRSEFFGRLIIVLADVKRIVIIGDRLVFQSEVFFRSGSVEINKAGANRIAVIALAVQEIAAAIPDEMDWVIQINGHTDIEKIKKGSKFRDNWHLSAERALAVVNMLVSNGAPPEHLVAAGYGEFRPARLGTTHADLAANRRIELELTSQASFSTIYKALR